MYMYIYVYVYVYMYMYIYMFIYMYIYISIYTYIHIYPYTNTCLGYISNGNTGATVRNFQSYIIKTDITEGTAGVIRTII
jgi:hypothetical protein